MMRLVLVLGVGAAALAGCARTGERPGGPVAIEADSISYETGPCFGACPVYSVTVRPDGGGVFIGKQHTAVTGERRFQLSRAQYEAFAAKLAPYRPQGGEVRYAPGEKNCGQVATDMPSVEVRWTRAIGDSQGLYFYYGCEMDRNEAMRNALGAAPEALPIEKLIGEHP
jgi:hypothetical protein